MANDTEDAVDVGKIETSLAKENVTEKFLGDLERDFLPLKIMGIEDKEGYKKVKEARITCRENRILVEKICKKGREKAIAEQKAWIAKEKEVTGRISKVEEYLGEQEKAIDDEKEKIRTEAARKEREKVESRINKLMAFNVRPDFFEIQAMSEEHFEIALSVAEQAFKEEHARLEKDTQLKRDEEARMKKVAEEQALEAKRLEDLAQARMKEEAEFEAKKKAHEQKVKDEEAAIQRERDRIEVEKKHQIELEKAKKEAAEKAKIEAEEKSKKEAKDKADKEARKKKEDEDREAAKPDNEKLTTFALSLLDFNFPKVDTPKANDILEKVEVKLRDVAKFISDQITK